MTYVLILLLTAAGSDGGNALVTASFEGLAACEFAAAEAKKLDTAGSYRRFQHRCVPAK